MNWISSYYLRYAGLGFSVIPIKTLAYCYSTDVSERQKEAKRPLVKWQQYQTTRPDSKQLIEWALQWPLAGVGILTGLLSDLFVVDDDRKGRPPLVQSERSTEQEQQYQKLVKRYGSESAVAAAYQMADDFCEALAALPTAISRTGKGKHYYFRMPRDANGFAITIGDCVKFLPGLDTRAEGGYVLAPPSLHPSGTAYVWERSPEDGILELPPWVLQAVQTLPNFAHYAIDHVNPAPAGALMWNRKPETLWRMGQYGVAEGERNETAASMAGKIIASIDNEIHWNQGYDVFRTWNKSNVPPMGEDEVRATWNSICDREREKRNTTTKALYQPHIFNSEVELFTARAIGIMDLHAPDYAVKDFVVDGTTQLFGKPKAGKSFLALQIAIAVALGVPLFEATAAMYAFANHPQGFGTHHGDVLYLALEDSKLRLQTRMKAILGTADPRFWPERLELAIHWENCHEGGLTKVENWINATKEPRLVVADTVAAFMGASGQDKGSVFRAEYRMFRPIWEVSQRYKIPFLLVDHASKGKGKFGSGDPFDAGAGTLGSQAAVDTVMIMEHDDKRPMARLSMKGRDVERGFIDLEHTKTSPVWKLASEPITQESSEAKARKAQASEAQRNGKIARSVDPFTIPKAPIAIL